MIYMDHNATTPILPVAVKAMMRWLTAKYGNASSAHSMGQEARDAVELARSTIAYLIGAKTEEIYFTSGGTEADNWAILGSYTFRVGIMVSAIEHHAVLKASRRIKYPYRVILPVDGTGRLSIPHLKGELNSREKGRYMISVMHANNETGMIQPIKKVSELAHEHNDIVHTDAIQAFGKFPVNVKDLDVDMMSISAHKIGGPKGVGALYVKKLTAISPFITGGHQERDMRAGTENVAGIVGFAAAAQWCYENMDILGDYLIMRKKLLDGITSQLDDVKLNTVLLDHSIANTLNLGFKGVDSEALVMLLDQEGICVSNGAACESGVSEPSHVLMAMGRSPGEARSAIRFSLGHTNTVEEVDIVVEAVVRLVKMLRGGAG